MDEDSASATTAASGALAAFGLLALEDPFLPQVSHVYIPPDIPLTLSRCEDLTLQV